MACTLASALQRSGTINVLHLGGNPIGPKGEAALRSALSGSDYTLCKLKRMELAHICELTLSRKQKVGSPRVLMPDRFFSLFY